MSHPGVGGRREREASNRYPQNLTPVYRKILRCRSVVKRSPLHSVSAQVLCPRSRPTGVTSCDGRLPPRCREASCGSGYLFLPRLPPSQPNATIPVATPRITPDVALGSNCDNATYYAFGVTSWGRLVFCGSPRRYDPRWFRSPEMHGVKQENSPCPDFLGDVAQAPDGLFLICVAKDGHTFSERGDL